MASKNDMKRSDMVAFKVSRKGYNKTDVNNYIAEMNRRFSETEAEFRSVNRQLGEQNTQFPALHDRLGEVQKAYESLREENSAITAKCAELIRQNDEQAQRQLQLENELNLLRSRLENSKTNPTPEKSEPAYSAPAAEHISEFDHISKLEDILSDHAFNIDKLTPSYENNMYDDPSKVGNTIIRAELDGENIRARAKAEAGEIIASAKRQADAIISESRISGEMMIDRMKIKLSAMADEYMNMLAQFQSKSMQDCDASLYLLKKKLKDIHTDLEDSAKSVSEELNSTINAISRNSKI